MVTSYQPPRSWASHQLIHSASQLGKEYSFDKRSWAERFGIGSSPLFVSDNGDTCLPEILAISAGKRVGANPNLIRLSSVSQAFSTYAISLYDQIQDNHLSRGGVPTQLARYGPEHTAYIQQKYVQIFLGVGDVLSGQGVPLAREILESQYDETITFDYFRNNPGSYDLPYALVIQDWIAGRQTKKIAVLLGQSGELEACLYSLGNALSTLDDLIDCFYGDLDEQKTTIPKAVTGNYASENSERLNLLRSDTPSLREIQDYLLSHLETVRAFLSRNPAPGDILDNIVQETTEYILCFGDHPHD